MQIFAGFVAAILALLNATFVGGSLSASTGAHATLIFGGDMMFDRTVRTTIEKNGGDYVFSCIDPTLADADLVVANLEGPITGEASQSVGSAVGSPENFVFTFPISTALLLSVHHVGVVNLGNNHIMNFGLAGVRTTTEALRAAHVKYFGDPLDVTVAHATPHGIALAFINYNEFGSTSLTTSAASNTIVQIQAARAAGELPILYTHWGIEYATTSPQYVRDLAHRFVDAGAAIVIGSHPHVVEDSEVYRGVPIYYSLGNFIFDQYWVDAVRHGLLLKVIFTPQGVGSIQEIPIELKRDRRTCLLQ